jgi:predicted protein tyrosine phosphatase
MSILVCPLSQLDVVITERRPGRVVSVLDPGRTFPELGPSFAGRHLRLSFHDAHGPAPGILPPSSAHVAELLDFVDAWDTDEPLLVHCRAGIGRSTAAAFVAACHRNPDASERHIALALRSASPLARPNERVVRLADEMMDRGGRMLEAILETGRGLPWVEVVESTPFEIASRYDGTNGA